MQIKVTPTRMELLRLKKRLELARRGHKLLEDKLEGLIKEFMPLVGEYVALRNEADERLPGILRLFSEAAAETGEDRLREVLPLAGLGALLDLTFQRRAGVDVPLISASIERQAPCYGLVSTPEVLDQGVSGLAELLPVLLEAAEKEIALLRLAAEIERTRRRVNALEYVLIPRLIQARKYIQAKLDEDERSARIRNMKVKEILEKAARR